jgi:hypothetical protein
MTPKMSSCQQKTRGVLLAIAVSFCCSELTVVAQGDFGSFQVTRTQSPQLHKPADYSKNYQTLQPPAAVQQTQRLAQPVLARPESSWPDQPVQYDDFVRQVNLEQSGKPAGVNRLIGDTVDSAGQLLGSWKDKLGATTNQLLSTDGTEASHQGWLGTIKQKANSPDVRRMLGSLALVVGGYLALVVVLRKLGGGSQRGIPAEVVSVLGNLPYGHKQNLRLVRLGSKLVLLLNGPEGTHPIGEITNPDEVDYLVSLCKGKRAVRPPSPVIAAGQRELNPESGVRGITEESLSQVLRRLEQATRGGAANYEA